MTVGLQPNEVEAPSEYSLKNVPPAVFGSRFAKAYNFQAAPGRPTRITVGAWSKLISEWGHGERVVVPTTEVEIRRLVPERSLTPGGATTKWHSQLQKTLALPLERRSERPTKFFRPSADLVGAQIIDSFALKEICYFRALDKTIFEALAHWATHEAVLEADDATAASATINIALAKRAGANLLYHQAFG